MNYLDLDTRPHFSAASSEVSPRLAVKRVTLLASHQQFRDAAEFIHRLPGVTVRSALTDLPMDTLVEAMPLSLPVIEAIYCTAGEVSAEVLHVERVVWQMVRFFAQQEECLTGDIRWEFCGPFVNLCRDVLRVVAKIQPSLRRTLLHRRRQLERAIEGMGHHGLVGTSDESLTSLHDALKLEFEKVVKSYTAALATLQELGTGNKGHNISKGPAPIQASHQRQLSIAPQDIQERLIKNKSLLNIVEPTLGNHSLDILLGILQRRIEHDKDALFQFTQLRKEAKDIPADAVVAPIIMRYAHGCDQFADENNAFVACIMLFTQASRSTTKHSFTVTPNRMPALCRSRHMHSFEVLSQQSHLSIHFCTLKLMQKFTKIFRITWCTLLFCDDQVPAGSSQQHS
ncbi:hypothetical protein HAZT_HAZT003847 [Hyalella azteca]|uniref:Uncharacterized protein n=1 Tax=Hyalella azteca TaxID=294128 RepID=A0A6A0GX82_HYAAZ|nr:hypothetical protein HAZT_HAZT003847 [Hyalella azteca]